MITRCNLVIDNQEMNLESNSKGLTVGGDGPNLVDHNGSPVDSSNTLENVVESSSVEQSKLVAATTPKEEASVLKGVH